MKSLLTLLAALGLTASAPAAIIVFDLIGKAGTGLLATNETGAVTGTPGSGMESGGGIEYDDVSNTLTIRFSWSGLQGALAGSNGMASGAHIHLQNAGTTVLNGNGSVMIDFLSNTVTSTGTSNGTLFGFSAPAFVVSNLENGSGAVAGTVQLSAAAEDKLLSSQKNMLYINVHSTMNPGGEFRGNLVPEPSAGLALLAAATVIRRRRR
jgi:CHRD domain